MTPADDRRDWELAAEAIVVRLRWFGVATGYVLVQTRSGLHDPWAVRAFLALGAGYAGLETAFRRWGEVFLDRWPLGVAAMESVFIALLCYHDTGTASPFRWYYLLSAICCAIRYRPAIAWSAVALHAASLSTLAGAIGPGRATAPDVAVTLLVLAWATWAASALAGLLKATGDRLAAANAALARHGAELEREVADRTAALRAAQARVIHQEKMAALGLLAAGVAHEVGNPLAALSSLVQLLRRRAPDPYSAEKLELADAQVGRLRRTVRELVEFARPASLAPGRVRLADVVEEVLSVAKYYGGTRHRVLSASVPAALPPLVAVRDHLVQVLLNLVLNAIDATEPGGSIRLWGRAEAGAVLLGVEDDGRGVPPADRDRLFGPHFTTKPHGTGLGLFVSRQIVEEMGGSLSYHPRPDGPGSVFLTRLPTPTPAPALPEPVVAGEGAR